MLKSISMEGVLEQLYYILCWTFECHSSFHSNPTQSFVEKSEKRSNPAYGPAPLTATSRTYFTLSYVTIFELSSLCRI